MAGRPQREDASDLIRELTKLMSARRLNLTKVANILGLSASTLSRSMKANRLSGPTRARLLHEFPDLHTAASGGQEASISGTPQASLGQILHLLRETDSILEDIKTKVVSLAEVAQGGT